MNSTQEDQHCLQSPYLVLNKEGPALHGVSFPSHKPNQSAKFLLPIKKYL